MNSSRKSNKQSKLSLLVSSGELLEPMSHLQPFNAPSSAVPSLQCLGIAPRGLTIGLVDALFLNSAPVAAPFFPIGFSLY